MLKYIKIKEDVIEAKNIRRILIQKGFVEIEYDDPYSFKNNIKVLARIKNVEFISGE